MINKNIDGSLEVLDEMGFLRCSIPHDETGVIADLAREAYGFEQTGLDPDEVKILKNHVKLLERDRQWIPVSERLPGHDGQYITCFDDGFIATATYSTCKDGTHDWELWEDSGEVVAWQLLPEPYREG